ncbi:hypothetical protein FOXG_19466 [Fusarium oxysporum f. sp. lycopersici 4287]|uniref:Uncharacterized protein n=1 Tax=Fusarium oxysporum f. sp. lycopersici (strain 4287 / CBS 123668 / FGSC 9935 / NRRL 34936) TaxID=426428 RepID=A0A0J9V063_FUSO4|nr:hypothetical protein FOXG_19466 [Fusarium oxysporum f. sp. lycopersici 4287]KAJ9412382.1 hypothetical protein QL093DRAFT_2552481 [Fusarium oxysporum]KNB04959.1 hypothetical protein FOXG_19466 [Fusarium oxysporum f. sp. lycopersici 4287]
MSTMASITRQVPGLNCPVTADTFCKSRKIYNCNTEDTSRTSIEAHLPNLQKIFVNHKVYKKFAIHSRHGHFKLDEDRILLGTTSTAPLCRWTQQRSIDDVDPGNIHGHIFVVHDGELIPYEYHEGCYKENIPERFLDDFIKYILINSLCSEVALQVLLPEFQDQLMSEIAFEDQTIMVDAEYLNGLEPGNTTCWIFSPRGYTAGETHAMNPSGRHEKYNVGAPLPDGVKGVCRTLVDRNLLRPNCLTA